MEARISRLKPKYRQGRCYELAYKHLERDDRFTVGNWTLVHGEVISPANLNDQPLGHAWLQHGDRIYDIGFDREFDSQTYFGKYKAKTIASYTRAEAFRLILAHGHYGPWHGQPGLRHENTPNNTRSRARRKGNVAAPVSAHTLRASPNMVAKLVEAGYLKPDQHHDAAAVEKAINALKEDLKKLFQNLGSNDTNDDAVHQQQRK